MPDSNIDLSIFEEKISSSRKEVKPLNVLAYRMDGNSQNDIERMAKYAGLGALSCCDYLYIDKERAILIEDTCLGWQMQKLKLELKDFSKEKQEKEFFRVKEILRQENCLKVYGTLLVLCRMARKYKNISPNLDGKEFSFWLVVNDEEDIKAIDNMEIVEFLKEELKKSLQGTVSAAKLLKKTEVLFLTELKEKLQI